MLFSPDISEISLLVKNVSTAYSRFNEIYPFLVDLAEHQLIIVVYKNTDQLIASLDEFYSGNDQNTIPGGYFSADPIPHIALCADNIADLDAILAHEMVHWSLCNCCTPNWIEEGYATGIETSNREQAAPIE